MQNRNKQRPRFRGTAAVSCLALVLIFSLVLSGCDLTDSDSGNAASTPTAIVPQDTSTPAPPTATSPPPPTPTETPIPPTPTPRPRGLSGKVTDMYTGQPVNGAQITAGGVLTATNPAGQYFLEDVPDHARLVVEAPGYADAEFDTGTGSTLDVALRPTTIRGRITDQASGRPVFGAIVRIDIPSGAPAEPAAPEASPTITDSAGRIPGLAAQVEPTATLAAAPAVTGTDTTTATATLTATLVPATPTPSPTPIMPRPVTRAGMILAVTDQDGYYTLENVPEGVTMTVKMPGYRLEKVALGAGATRDVALTPFAAKALYITANAASYAPLFDPIMELADTTEINAIVLNIQDDAAEVVYDTKIEMAQQAGAVNLLLPNIRELVAELHSRDIYVIARMVTFMQPAVADAYPELSVISAATGKPWIGGELSQQRWLDPTNPASHEYPLALMREAVELGFDEVQLDYIRFPSDPSPGEKWDNMRFSRPVENAEKGSIIGAFLQKAHGMMNETDAFLSIDVFGYTVWPNQEGVPMNEPIGQVFEQMAPYTDFICPMIYPSHFSYGEMGFERPNEHPYEIIKQAGVYAADRLQGMRTKNRPWLQGFDWASVVYDEKMYRLQIDAAEETGATGWMFWDPHNVYYNGFKPEE